MRAQETLTGLFSYLRGGGRKIRAGRGIQRIWDLFLHFYRRSVSSSLRSPGRLIVLIRGDTELNYELCARRYGKVGLRYTMDFSQASRVVKFETFIASGFALHIRNSGRFNGEECWRNCACSQDGLVSVFASKNSEISSPARSKSSSFDQISKI